MKIEVQRIPDDNHVMRYIPWTRLIKDESENIIGVFPQAYERRINPQTLELEEALSVNWIEFHPNDEIENINISVRALRTTISVGKKSAFAIGMVGAIKAACEARSAKIRVLHDPIVGNPAHAGIRHLPTEDLDLLDTLAADVFAKIILNKDIPVRGDLA